MKNVKYFINYCLLAMGLFLLGTAGSQAQPPAGPMSEVLDKLDALQNQITNLQTNLPPTWSQQFPAGERFVLLDAFNNEAVLDRETGLVWEQAPDITEETWGQALHDCYTKEVGGRKGWRLPTAEELSSLLDSSQSAPALPSGHPFSVAVSLYWSATNGEDDGANNFTFTAYQADLNSGAVGRESKNGTWNAWCVRGANGHDGSNMILPN